MLIGLAISDAPQLKKVFSSEAQGKATSSLLGLSPLPSDESVFIESLAEPYYLKSITVHIRKEKPGPP
jgi:hypothetical protein